MYNESGILELCHRFKDEMDLGFWKLPNEVTWNISYEKNEHTESNSIAFANCIMTITHEEDPSLSMRIRIDLCINKDILLDNAYITYLGNDIRTPISWDYQSFNSEVMAQRLNESLDNKPTQPNQNNTKV